MSSANLHPRAPLFILSVATGYGGAERNIELMLPHLAAHRKVVIFACNPHHLVEIRKVDRPGLEVHRIDAGQDGFVARGARLVMRRCFALRPSAILANTLDSLRIVSQVARYLPGIDTLSHFYVHDFQWFDYEALMEPMARATLLVPDRSVLDKPAYVGRFVWPHGAIRSLVLPNPVDLPADPPGQPPAAAGFLHLATVNPFKGHAYLVEAARFLREAEPDIHIDSYGHRPIPELHRELLYRIKQATAGQGISLHEPVSDPSDLVRRARAVLVTSISDQGGPESFGRSVIEAWAQSRPVIAFAAGGPARLIRHEVDGLLVDERDTRGLADAIIRLHRDPDLADRLGRNGRVRVAQEFATDVVLQRLNTVLDGGWSVRPAPAMPAPSPIAAPDEAGRTDIIFDVSLSLEMGWHPPVGMSRVEADVADALACRTFPVKLVRRNAQTGDYRRLGPLELEFLANRSDGIGELAGRELVALTPPPARRPLSVRRFLKALGTLSIASGTRFAGGPVRRWLHTRAERKVRRPVFEAPPFSPQPGDRLVSVSNPWDYVSAGTFTDLRAKGVLYDLVVHDLMVWDTPYWTAGRDPQDYARNMLAVLAGANRLVCVSRATAAVTERAFAEIGRPVPPIAVAHPAGLSPALVPRGAPPQGFDLVYPFVVYCSTIEVRKNHLMLLTLWERLRQTLSPERLPRLIIAGRWGWCVDAVRLMVQRNWRLAPHVQIFEDLRDENLGWLYRNARFSVFPSFTEGFGLPVAESLAVGTPVVVSNTPALIEASRSLMPALDPYDLSAWQREITALCLDEARLDHLRRQARLYRPAQPEDVPHALLSDIGAWAS